MIIKDLSYDNKNDLFNVEFENEVFKIDFNTYDKLRIKKNDEINFDAYKIIVDNNDYNMAKKKALDYLNYCPRTTFEIINKLKKEKYNQNIIDEVIKFLNKYNLLDDKKYIEDYINDKMTFNRMSKKKIAFNLKSKGLDSYLVDTLLNEVDEKIEYENCLYLLKKKIRGDLSFQMKQKAYRYLTYRGFSYDIISDCINEVFK
ncbi:MAG: regulatory protein RecX [Tissierellia bacterium]|nr:regulatory protein RecX [Tissierellia bacterium]